MSLRHLIRLLMSGRCEQISTSQEDRILWCSTGRTPLISLWICRILDLETVELLKFVTFKIIWVPQQ